MIKYKRSKLIRYINEKGGGFQYEEDDTKES